MMRSHYCGELRREDVGKEVTLCGWVEGTRDLGALIFIDLRDREGKTQIVFREESNKDNFLSAGKIRSEFVLQVKGKVVLREGNINKDMKTGEIEVEVEELDILNASEVPPFEVVDDVNASEELRLKYRYLDLRRKSLQHNIAMRSRIVHTVRSYFIEKGFLDIETPNLLKSTPEGARDYVVPSRVHKGKFYALPQSPQIMKQLLMVSGFDRYFQIARCFRDEDLRAHRQPEFTQIDVEMSFAEPQDIMDTIEGMMGKVLDLIGIEHKLPFPVMSYKEAMDRFGSDAPDTRYGMELNDISDIVRDSAFKVFSSVVEGGGVVKAVCGKGMAEYSRKMIDNLEEFVKGYGAKGLAWIKLEESEIKSPIAKFLSEDELNGIISSCGAEKGDMIMIVAGAYGMVVEALGRLRKHIAAERELVDLTANEFLWVVDFPLVEYDEEGDRFVAKHHPFTMPLEEDMGKLDSEPENVRAQAYDLVWNGVELGGGSIRIHRTDIQEKIFGALGFSEKEAQSRFGFLLNALKYGAPPHGGIALGVDRLVMSCVGAESLRDVIAFPKTTSASDLMMESPSGIDEKQLKELSLKLDKK